MKGITTEGEEQVDLGFSLGVFFFFLPKTLKDTQGFSTLSCHSSNKSPLVGLTV